MSKTSSDSRRERTRLASSALMIGGLLSMLIWGKLRFVSDVPRTAYAVPGEAPAQPDQRAPDSGEAPNRGLEDVSESGSR